MTGRAVALQHTVAVTKYLDAVVTIEAAALGISDALIRFQRCLLGARRHFNGFVRGHFRRMEQVKIRGFERQQIFVRHASTWVWRGVARDIQRRLHGTGNGVRAQVS